MHSLDQIDATTKGYTLPSSRAPLASGIADEDEAVPGDRRGRDGLPLLMSAIVVSQTRLPVLKS